MKYILYIVLLGFLAVSCYDDLGNYDYNEELNDVSVAVNRLYGVRKVDTTFVIRPVITQNTHNDNSNLRYAWTVNNSSDQTRGDTLSRGDTLAIRIDPLAGNFKYIYYIRFYIWDTITGAKQMFPVTLEIAKPYEGAWMVQHFQDGVTKLGCVEYVGDQMLVINDAYYKETGTHLKGYPMGLGVRTFTPYSSYWGFAPASLFYCFTDDPEESGVLRQDNRFELYGDMERSIYSRDYPDFSLADIRFIGEGNGSILLSNGKVFQGSSYGPRMYGMYPADDVTGDYDITHAASAPAIHLVFDSEGKRFLSCYTQGNYYYLSRWTFAPDQEQQEMLRPMKKSPNNVAGVDLDNIGEDKMMVYMGVGYWYGQGMMTAWQRMAIYAYAKSKSTNKSYVYEFHPYAINNVSDANDNASLPAMFTITNPSGVTEHTLMATSSNYNRLLFYAVDNRIYRLDFGTADGSSTLIYQHPDGSAKATVMKMAREAYNDTKFDANYGHSPARSLGVVFDLPDGTNEFVVLNLNAAGKVDSNGKYPAIQRHSHSNDGQAFGKIRDVAFI